MLSSHTICSTHARTHTHAHTHAHAHAQTNRKDAPRTVCRLLRIPVLSSHTICNIHAHTHTHTHTHTQTQTDKTHRELFADFYASLFHAPLEGLIAQGQTPEAAQKLWAKMSSDITMGGGAYSSPMEQVWVWVCCVGVDCWCGSVCVCGYEYLWV